MVDINVDFYTKRLCYYDSQLKYLKNNIRIYDKVKGFGSVDFDLDYNGVVDTYNFWLSAMIWFIETERCKNCENKYAHKTQSENR